MGKKRTLAIIMLLCVLGGLIACGRKEKEEDKDKFENKISDLIEKNKIFDRRIEKSNLKKYVQLEINRFDKKKSQKRT